jgi:glycosyltransferase involved in cell wall biosynthesis
MRIVIDLQAAQSESRFRGIGRYSQSLALELARSAGPHEVWIALNAAFQRSIFDIRRAFDGLVPQEHIRVFAIPTPVAECDSANTWRTRTAEKIREYFLHQMRPDVVHVSSVFEGWVDDAVTSVGAFTPGENTAITYYDLIPLLHQSIYLPSKVQRTYYLRKVQSLKNARLLLAISESSRREAIDVLGLPEDRVINIPAAVEAQFCPIPLSEERRHQICERYGIHRKTIMYVPGGFDSRKNIDGLLRAYAMLPSELRAKHQLLIVSKINDNDRAGVDQLRKQAGLAEHELLLTGYVADDELVALYNMTTLFVFPSKHEGFGLPVLEAMACGAPTIGSNTTSIPEIIGTADALFDPASVQSIADKITQVLKDESFLARLREEGLTQAGRFSWQKSAKRLIAAYEAVHPQNSIKTVIAPSRRPKLAYVSPLPPERSGISDYSAELLPELACYYNVEAIIAQDKISDPWVDAIAGVRSVHWFYENAYRYDRILYHFGNSLCHSHMFSLLRRHPGVVVLHDFFLSGVLEYAESSQTMPGAWTTALYHSHGYRALLDRDVECGRPIAGERYPCNLEVIQHARGVIVHSEYSKGLARNWYSQQTGDEWIVIPALRKPYLTVDRVDARKSLGINEDDFVICTFGFIDPTKCSERVLEAWFASRLVYDSTCLLIFVGENHGGQYGQRIVDTIRCRGLENRVIITGWIDTERFNKYLAAADVGVQLRCVSRGETSRSVLDCMTFGLPTITNANGSAAEIPRHAVWMLRDEFTNAELIEALETLHGNVEQRRKLGAHARDEILINHSPRVCAGLYAQTIESIYQRTAADQHALVESIAATDAHVPDELSLELAAESISLSSDQPRQRQLLIDVSSIVRNDLKTGIERVVTAQLTELIRNPPAHFRIEPVYLTGQGSRLHYRYATSYTCKTFGIEQGSLVDVPIEIARDDIVYIADYCPNDVIEAAKVNLYPTWRAMGLSINVLVYDLLPILKPECFPDGTSITHAAWLTAIAEFASRLICISNSVADELRSWLKRNPPKRQDPLLIDAVHLGADFKDSPQAGLPSRIGEELTGAGRGPIFLMVGTIEPRKGHLQAIAAFECLWREGHDATLIVVGNEGWTHLARSQRRTIPETIERLRHHPELRKRLFWLKRVGDEGLVELYRRADALIMASEGEGFGLPLIEAAQHGLPIIARDIPVFREVGGDDAYYFDGNDPGSLASCLKDWLSLRAAGRVTQPKAMRWLTWRESTKKLLSVILSKTDVLENAEA